MRDGADDGMQHFDGEIERLIRDKTISLETGMSYATNPTNLRLQISDLLEEQRQAIKLTKVEEPARAGAYASGSINPSDIIR